MIANDIGVVILAGGEATRLPEKLSLAVGNIPMIARVYRNVSPRRETAISCKSTFPPEIDALLLAPMVVDRWSRRGPLSGMVTTMEQMRSPFVFAVAGDAPFIDATFIDALAANYAEGDDAIVPMHPERRGKTAIEPLAAIYDRRAFLREALPVLARGDAALRAVIDRLNARFVPVNDERIFANVNTNDDYVRLQAQLGQHG